MTQNFFLVLKLGWGFQWITYTDYKPYFSERYGYRLPIVKTKKWRIFLLKPIKKKKIAQNDNLSNVPSLMVRH